MSNLTKTDLTERLKSAACCAAELADKAAKEKSYGLKCYKDTLRELKLLTTYIEILCEYRALDITLIKIVDITITSTTINSLWVIVVEGETIASYTDTTGVTSTLLTTLATIINNTKTNPDYTASVSGSILYLYKELDGDLNTSYNINVTVTGGSGYAVGVATNTPNPTSTDSIEDGDQCITEEEAQNLFEKITTICNTCYKTIGATYP